ncbi:MAG: hypothetical protein OXC28_10650 [Defluviicoccus sp.]|nr:hypothetical protein [Defluviicoccus sp.]
MKPHTAASFEPAVTADAPASPGDEARKRAIAQALWTEIHWLMPSGRTVAITVDGDDIAVEFGPVDSSGKPTAH